MKEKLDKEVKQLQVDMEAKMGNIKALNQQGQRAKEEQQRLEQQLKELKVGGVMNGAGHIHILCGVLFRKTMIFVIRVENINGCRIYCIFVIICFL